METQKKCKELVRASLKGIMADITKLWELYQKDYEASDPNLGTWNDYGLCVDYVTPGTFERQRRGYIRFQLSWGGPSEEFRFFLDERRQIDRVDFWCLNWFDGAKITLRGEHLETMTEIFEDWREIGAIDQKIEEAT